MLAIADEGGGADGDPSGTGLSIVRALVGDELHGTLRGCERRARRGRVPGVTGAREVLVHVRRGGEFLVARRPRITATGTPWRAASSPARGACRRRPRAARRDRAPRPGLREVGTFEHVRESWEGDPGRRVQVHAFLAEAPGGWEPELNEEHDEYRWLPRDAAAELLFWPEPAAQVRGLPERGAAAVRRGGAARALARRAGRLDPPLRAARRAGTGRSTPAPSRSTGSRAGAPRATSGPNPGPATGGRAFLRRRSRSALARRRAGMARADADDARRRDRQAGGRPSSRTATASGSPPSRSRQLELAELGDLVERHAAGRARALLRARPDRPPGRGARRRRSASAASGSETRRCSGEDPHRRGRDDDPARPARRCSSAPASRSAPRRGTAWRRSRSRAPSSPTSPSST